MVYFLWTISAQERGYGDPDLAYQICPTGRRGRRLLTNACRMDPVGYRDEYVGDADSAAVLIHSGHYWQVDLNRAARLMLEICHRTVVAAYPAMEIAGLGLHPIIKQPFCAENIASGREHRRNHEAEIMDGTPPAEDKSVLTVTGLIS